MVQTRLHGSLGLITSLPSPDRTKFAAAHSVIRNRDLHAQATNAELSNLYFTVFQGGKRHSLITIWQDLYVVLVGFRKDES